MIFRRITTWFMGFSIAWVFTLVTVSNLLAFEDDFQSDRPNKNLLYHEWETLPTDYLNDPSIANIEGKKLADRNKDQTDLEWLTGARGGIIQDSTLERKVVNSNIYPWSSVGLITVLLNTQSKRNCTATLIGERLVLTAAHCLFINELGVWAKPGQVNFTAGYQRGDYLALARGVKLYFDDNYGKLFGRGHENDMTNLVNDWALVALNQPIGLSVGYLGWKSMSDAEIGEFSAARGMLALAGYPRDRQSVLSLENHCQSLGLMNKGKLLGHRCHIVNGDSGASLMLMNANQVTVVAVNSATGINKEGEPLNSAIPLSRFHSILIQALSETESKAIPPQTLMRKGFVPLNKYNDNTPNSKNIPFLEKPQLDVGAEAADTLKFPNN